MSPLAFFLVELDAYFSLVFPSEKKKDDCFHDVSEMSASYRYLCRDNLVLSHFNPQGKREVKIFKGSCIMLN